MYKRHKWHLFPLHALSGFFNFKAQSNFAKFAIANPVCVCVCVRACMHACMHARVHVCSFWQATLDVLMLVVMTLILMQGHCGSADEKTQRWIISTSKQVIRFKLSTMVGYLFYVALTLTLKTLLWLDQLVFWLFFKCDFYFKSSWLLAASWHNSSNTDSLLVDLSVLWIERKRICDRKPGKFCAVPI